MDDHTQNRLEARIATLESRVTELERKKLAMPSLDEEQLRAKLAESKTWIERNPFAAVGIAFAAALFLSIIF